MQAPDPAPAPTAGCAEAGSPEAEDAKDAGVAAAEVVAAVAVAVGAGDLRESLHAWVSARVLGFGFRGLRFRDSGLGVWG